MKKSLKGSWEVVGRGIRIRGCWQWTRYPSGAITWTFPDDSEVYYDDHGIPYHPRFPDDNTAFLHDPDDSVRIELKIR